MRTLTIEEQIQKQLFLINFNRSKTLNEQVTDLSDFSKLVNEILTEQSQPEPISDNQKAIDFVVSLGSPKNLYDKTMTYNQVLSWYALNSIRELTNLMISKNNIGNSYCFTLKINTLSNAPKKFQVGSFTTDDSLKLKLLKYINSSEIREKKERTIGNTIFLEDFYYNWPKIVEDWRVAYSVNPNSTKSVLFPDGWYNFMNFWFGTTNLVVAKANVNKITTQASCSGANGGLMSLEGVNYVDTQDEIVEVLHRTLEGLSLISALFPGWPGFIASAAFDLIDASLYMWYDKDPWMAGLMVCFALIPADIVFRVLPSLKNFTKNQLTKFFGKILNKTGDKLLSSEIRLLKEIGSRLFLREVYILIIKESIGKFLSKIYLKGFTKLLLFLVKKGYLLGSFLFKMGLYIGGVFLSWSVIAKKLGIGVEGAIKQSSINAQDDLTPVIIDSLGEAADQNLVYSEKKFKNYFSENVFYMQLFLYYGQYDTYTENIQTNNLTNDQLNAMNLSQKKIQNKFKFYEVEDVNGTPFIRIKSPLYPKQNELKKGDNIKISYSKLSGSWVVDKVEKNSSNQIYRFSVKQQYSTTRGFMDDPFIKKLHSACGIKNHCYVYGDIEVIIPETPSNVIAYDDLLKKQAKVEDIKFKWGFYDNQTVKAIKTFQFKNGLTIDGTAGKNTINKIIKLLKGEFPIIKNISNVDVTKQIEDNLNRLLTDNQNDEKLKEIPTQQVEIIYEEQKESEVREELQKGIDEMMRQVPEFTESKIINDSTEIAEFQNQ